MAFNKLVLSIIFDKPVTFYEGNEGVQYKFVKLIWFCFKVYGMHL